MKKTLLALALLLATLAASAQTGLTRSYSRRPLSEVLADIDKSTDELSISFIYNKLEDYPVTCQLSGEAPYDAILKVIGFYPVKVTRNGNIVIVEPISDTEGKIIGRIVDEQDNPLEYANIALLSPTDSTLISGGITNASGDFTIPCTKSEVLLRASYIGYQTLYKNCRVGNIGTISLKEDPIAISEVRKYGTRPLARMERGALVYDMPFLLSVIPADNAYEALTRIPGVNEINGRVDFAGQTVTLIINGKATTLSADQVVERLRQMPAERLEKCEVMMSAPARLHVRGAVINIVTKDNYGQKQLAGQVSAGEVFSRKSYGGVSGTLLYSQGKFSLDAAYNYSGGDTYARADHQVVHPLESGPEEYWDITENVSGFQKHQVYTQMEYAFAQDHRIDLTYDGRWTTSNSNNTSTGTLPVNQSSETRNYINNVDLSYSAPFGLKLGATYLNFKYPQTQLLDNTIHSSRQNILSESGQDIEKWLLTADQSHSLSKNWTLNYGAQMQITNHNSWQEAHTESGETISESTGSVGYTEKISSLYASVSKEWTKVSAELGAQAENYNTPQWNEWRFYPTMNLLWRANQNNLFNLSFSSNSSYPSYWSLMNKVYYSNAYSEIWGNPDLKPMSSYNLSLTWQLHQLYTLTAFYDYDDKFFVQLPYQPSERMAVIMQEVNFNYRQNAGLAASAQWRIGNWANCSATAAMIYTHDKNDHFHDIPFDRENLGGRLMATAVFKPFAKQELRLILQPVYQFATIQGVFDIHDFFSLDASVRWTNKTGRLTASLNGHNLTNFFFQTSVMQGNQNYRMIVNQDWRYLQLSLTYKFGNYRDKKRKEPDTSRMGH